MRVGGPAESFPLPRGETILSTLADMWRPRGLKTNKVGTAFRSRHKCGDAFDCRQGVNYFVVSKTVKDYRGFKFTGCVLDFTALAGQYNWHRIPAHKGWKTTGPNYNKMEYWHYQQTQDSLSTWS